MNNALMIYVLGSVLTGAYYFYYWFKYEIPNNVKYAPKKMKALVCILVFILSTAFAPLSLIELYNKTKNKKENKL